MEIRGRAAALAFAAALAAAGAKMPGWVAGSVETLQVVSPKTVEYTPSVACSGSLKAGRVQEIRTGQPLMVQEVYVKEGEWVQKGQVLAEIDVRQSQLFAADCTAAQNYTAPSEIPEEYQALAKSYGVERQVQQYLSRQSSQDSGAAPAAEAAAVPQRITAPAAGQVTQVGVRAGTMLPGGGCAFTLATEACDTAVLRVDESNISQVKAGDRVVLTGPGLGEKTYEATLTDIHPTAETSLSGLAQTTGVTVEAHILDPDRALLPGLSVDATIVTGPESKLLALPYEAIAQDARSREYIYQLDSGGRLQKRYISVLRELADCVQVQTGLEPGQTVLYNAEEYDGPRHFKLERAEGWNE